MMCNYSSFDRSCSIIVGNKCDQGEDRRVDSAEGRNLAQKYHMDFVETSAKDGSNISTELSIHQTKYLNYSEKILKSD